MRRMRSFSFHLFPSFDVHGTFWLWWYWEDRVSEKVISILKYDKEGDL